MSIEKAISANAVVNNGGTALNAGTDFEIDPVLTNRLNSSRSDLGVFGSAVVQGDAVTTSTSSPYFAEVNEVLAKRVSATNVNDVLLSGAADPVNRKSILRMEAVRTTLWSTAFRADKFSLYTGKFQAGYPQVANDDAMVTSGGVYQDHAADPTRSVPGELVYRTGAKVPVSADYKAKNG
jgi:hypothetical protein